MIKAYPTEVEAVDETGSKIFTIFRVEEEVYRIDINMMFDKGGLD